jgi:hypothetical protein
MVVTVEGQKTAYGKKSAYTYKRTEQEAIAASQ